MANSKKTLTRAFKGATFDGNTMVYAFDGEEGEYSVDAYHPNARMVRGVHALREALHDEAEAEGREVRCSHSDFLAMVFSEAWMGARQILSDVVGGDPEAIARAKAYLALGFRGVGKNPTLDAESMRVNITSSVAEMDDAEAAEKPRT
jgi:hypothetical protein